MELIQTIKKFFKGEVYADEKTLNTYSHDASVFEVRPEVVAYPNDIEDIKKLVSFVSKEKANHKNISITARAAGTGMSGGSLNNSIILDVTKHIDRIKDMRQDRAILEPGVMCRDLDKEMYRVECTLPSCPASRNICALGGMVANNAGGEKTLNYGSTEKFVDEIKMVLRDGNEYTFGPLTKDELEQKMTQNDFEGEIYRNVWELIQNNLKAIRDAKPDVSKNTAGYLIWNVWDGTTFNLAKLFVGSQGTLGIISEITMRLTKPKPYSVLVVIPLTTFDGLGELVNKVLQHKPESFESYDDHTLSVAMKFLPNMTGDMAKSMISIGLSLIPLIFSAKFGRLPKMVLLAEFGDETQEGAEHQGEDIQKELAEMKIKSKLVTKPAEAAKYWTIRRESFNLLRHHTKHGRTAPFIDDIIVKPTDLPEFLPRLNKIMEKYDLTYTIAGHIGDANFHIMPIMDFTKPEAKEIFENLTKEVFALVFEFGGSMAGEHNDGIVRTPFLKQMYGEEVYNIFGQIKDIFDPENIFNPGKKVDGTWKYALDHLDTSEQGSK